jgi:hypothetical protein
MKIDRRMRANTVFQNLMEADILKEIDWRMIANIPKPPGSSPKHGNLWESEIKYSKTSWKQP